MIYITRYAGIFFNQDVLYFWQLSLIDKKSDTVPGSGITVLPVCV